MFKYELLPSHIKWLEAALEAGGYEELSEFALAIKNIATNFPNQSYNLEIFDYEWAALHELVSDEPIFRELTRELEIELA